MTHTPYDDDSDIDALLSEWGRTARTTAPILSVPSLEPTPSRSRRRHLFQILGAVVIVLAIAATVIGVSQYLNQTRTSNVPSGIGSPSIHPPPGFKAITFHGLTIDIPATWDVAVGEPCELTKSIVVLPGAAAGCGQASNSQLTIVEFLEGNNVPLTSTTRSTSTEIGSVPASRTEGYVGQRSAVGYAVPSLHASLLITPAVGETADHITATLRVVAIDANGCQAAVSDVVKLRRDQPPVRDGAAGALIPGEPNGIRVCRYQAGLLEEGATLTGANATGFVAALNALPAGLSQANDQPNPAQCKSPDSLGTVDAEDALDSEAYRIEADYLSGRPVVVTARLGLCGKLGASNGSRAVQRGESLARVLISAVGNSRGFPSDVTPSN